MFARKSQNQNASASNGNESNFVLGGRFGYFLLFLLGGGEGGVQGDREGWGVGFLIENLRTGGGVSARKGGAGAGGCLQGICRRRIKGQHD